MLQIYKTVGGQIREVDSCNSCKESGLWFNLTDPSGAEISTVSSRTGIGTDFLKAALDEEERPRIEAEDGQVLILIDIPFLVEEDSPVIYTTVPLGIVVTEDSIVTVCLRPTVLIKELLKRRTWMPAF